MKAIVNIGTEKTGTSSIQKFLTLNRENLVEQGFYFMCSTGGMDDRKLSAYCINDHKFDDFLRNNLIDTLEKKQAFEVELESAVEKELKALPASVHTVIFSSEHFHSRIRATDEREKLKSLLARFFDDVEILVYLRPQIEMAVSLYSTALKNHATCSIEAHLKQCKPDNYYYDYDLMLKGWEESFTKEKMIVRLFDRNSMLNGDVVADFCQTVGLDFTLLLKGPVMNESVRPTGQEMLRALNSQLPSFIEGIGRNQIRLFLAQWISEYYAGQGIQPSRAVAQSIQEQFIDCNEAVRQTWFPNRDQLFAIDLSKYDKQAELEEEKIEFFKAFVLGNDAALNSIDDLHKLIGSEAFLTVFPSSEPTIYGATKKNKNVAVSKIWFKLFDRSEIKRFIKKSLKK